MSKPSSPDRGAIVALIPIKDYRQAKNRLSERLDATAREALTRQMAENVVQAAGDLTVYVVCDDEQVAEWAKSLGANVFWATKPGLNPAITEAMNGLAEAFDHAIIAHADLPQAVSLDGIATSNTVSIVPDRHGSGTNVLSLPTKTEFNFQYGEGSLNKHMSEAIAINLDLKVLQIPALQWDVDTPKDLDGLSHFLKPDSLT